MRSATCRAALLLLLPGCAAMAMSFQAAIDPVEAALKELEAAETEEAQEQAETSTTTAAPAHVAPAVLAHDGVDRREGVRRMLAALRKQAKRIADERQGNETEEEVAEANASRGEPLQEQEYCRRAVQGEQCHKAVRWTRKVGIHKHPEWYSNLTMNSTWDEIQLYLNLSGRGNCSKPCKQSRMNVVEMTFDQLNDFISKRWDGFITTTMPSFEDEVETTPPPSNDTESAMTNATLESGNLTDVQVEAENATAVENATAAESVTATPQEEANASAEQESTTTVVSEQAQAPDQTQVPPAAEEHQAQAPPAAEEHQAAQEIQPPQDAQQQEEQQKPRKTKAQEDAEEYDKVNVSDEPLPIVDRKGRLRRRMAPPVQPAPARQEVPPTNETSAATAANETSAEQAADENSAAPAANETSTEPAASEPQKNETSDEADDSDSQPPRDAEDEVVDWELPRMPGEDAASAANASKAAAANSSEADPWSQTYDVNDSSAERQANASEQPDGDLQANASEQSDPWSQTYDVSASNVTSYDMDSDTNDTAEDPNATARLAEEVNGTLEEATADNSSAENASMEEQPTTTHAPIVNNKPLPMITDDAITDEEAQEWAAARAAAEEAAAKEEAEAAAKAKAAEDEARIRSEMLRDLRQEIAEAASTTTSHIETIEEMRARITDEVKKQVAKEEMEKQIREEVFKALKDNVK